MTADAHGWLIMGAGHRRAFDHFRQKDSRWLNINRINLVEDVEARFGMTEHLKRILFEM